MSASGSEASTGSETSGTSETSPSSTEKFVERDDQQTQLGYGEGRVPFLIMIVWVGFIITYITVMAILALPDLLAWSNR